MSWLKAVICDHDSVAKMNMLPLLCFKSKIENIFETFLDLLTTLVTSSGVVQTSKDSVLNNLPFRLGRAKVTKFTSYESRSQKYKKQFPLNQHLFIFFTLDDSYTNVEHVAGTRMIFGSDPGQRDTNIENGFDNWLVELDDKAYVELYRLVRDYST